MEGKAPDQGEKFTRFVREKVTSLAPGATPSCP